MADIFDEVEQDYRAERTRRLVARYGGVLAALLVVVVAGIGGVQGWRWWQARESGTAAAAYLAAADAPDSAERFAAAAAGAPPGYAALARLRAAAQTTDAEAARTRWDALARDGSAPPLYRDLAGLLWALSAIGTADRATIEARLAPIAEGPWRAGVAEARALAARAAGDTAAAERLYAALATDPATPAGIRLRAERLRGGAGG